jgi:hypothetical protein
VPRRTRRALPSVVFALLFVLTGCGSTPSSPSASSPAATNPSAASTTAAATASGQPSSSTTAPASASPASSATSAATAQVSGGALHACALLTAAQAGQVNGATYAAGQEHAGAAGPVPGQETTAPASSICVWQGPSAHASLTVQEVSDASPASAQARLATMKGTLQGFTVSDLTGFADAAFIARSPQGGISTGGIYAVHGSIFFDVVYLQGTAPSDSALEQAGTAVLGNLP